MMIKIFFSNEKEKLAQIAKPKAGCLVYVENPADYELQALADDHTLDADLLWDGLDPNEAPRIDKERGCAYIFTRFVLPESEKQTTSPVLIIFGVDMVYVISREPFDVLQRVLDRTDINTTKRAQLMLTIMHEVNAGYKRRINSVAKRMWLVRSQLNKTQIDNKDFIHFIDMEEDLNDFLSALEPMNTQLNSLLTGKFIQLHEDDKELIEDVELGGQELISLASSQLKTIKNVREAYSTITANNLNRVFKLMTSITILMGIFTLITGIYSMNIALPAAQNKNAFWIIIGITSSLITIVAVMFKKKRWF